MNSLRIAAFTAIVTMTCLIVSLAFAVGVASATTCTGVLAAGTFSSVLVPSGVSCTIPGGVTVTGNVTVASGAQLVISFGAIVNGSVLSKDAFAIFLLGATVGTNVSLDGTTGGVDFEFMSVGSNIHIFNTNGGFISVNHSTVTGNVLLQNNSTNFNLPGTGSDVITSNSIGGNLVCVNNTPPPTNVISSVAHSNTVGGTEVGQCVGL